MGKKQAILIALALPCAVCVLVFGWLADGVFWDTGVAPGREFRAALAIRDNVTTFQKWGTEVFTRGYLSRYYDDYWYFTQPSGGALEQEFIFSLDQALARYPQVDLFLLAHTNKYVAWVRKLPAERRARLRLVYNTGCHNLPQAQAWLDLGAKTYVGHPGVSISSVFYYFFMRRWTRGSTVQEAVDAGNALMERTFLRGEVISFGRWNAAAFMRESLASRFGEAGLCIEGHAP